MFKMFFYGILFFLDFMLLDISFIFFNIFCCCNLWFKKYLFLLVLYLWIILEDNLFIYLIGYFIFYIGIKFSGYILFRVWRFLCSDYISVFFY